MNFEKIFDVSVLVDIRHKRQNVGLRINAIGKDIGLSQEEINMIKNNKELKRRYQSALEESLLIYKGKSLQEEFLERLEEWKTNDEWNALDVLGYFCYKYEDVNKTDYIFTSTANPFRSKEMRFAAQLLQLMEKKEKVKHYIDWVLEKKQNKNFRIYGVGILLSSWLINEFNIVCKGNGKITRTTKLPMSYIEWCKENVPDLFNKHEFDTYGNLNTFIGMVKNNNANSDIIKVVERAKEIKIIKEGFLK